MNADDEHLLKVTTRKPAKSGDVYYFAIPIALINSNIINPESEYDVYVRVHEKKK